MPPAVEPRLTESCGAFGTTFASQHDVLQAFDVA